MKERYCLIQDNDCHWYVIPVSKKQEWFKWFDSEQYELGICPEWADMLGGNPSNVTFESYTK